MVLDAPPTGRIARFLNVNEEVAGLAKVGPIRNQASSIMTLLRSPQTAVHLVTVLEEMPVQETADARRRAARGRAPGRRRRGQHGARPGACAARGAGRPRREGRLDRMAAAWPRRAGRRRRARRQRPAALLADGLLRRGRRARGAGGPGGRPARASWPSLDRPTYELPALAGGIDLGALYELAEQLTEQGMA